MARLDPKAWSRVALAGTTYASRATSATSRVDQYVRLSTRSVWIDQGGQSDLLADMTAAAILVDMESYANNRRSAGYDVVVGTTIPHSTSYSLGQNNTRLALNSLILASASYDAVADLAADSRLADGSNTTYFSDGLHPTTAGAAAIADVVEATLATLSIN